MSYFELLPVELIYKIVGKTYFGLNLYQNIKYFKLNEEVIFRNLTVGSFPFMNKYNLEICYKSRNLSWRRIYEYLQNINSIDPTILIYYNIDSLINIVDTISLHINIIEEEDIFMLLLSEYHDLLDTNVSHLTMIRYEIMLCNYSKSHYNADRHVSVEHFVPGTSMQLLYKKDFDEVMMNLMIRVRIFPLFCTSNSKKLRYAYYLHDVTGIIFAHRFSYEINEYQDITVAIKNERGLYEPLFRSHTDLITLLTPRFGRGYITHNIEFKAFLDHIHGDT